MSPRVQNRYVRRPADLPLSGRRVLLTIAARRFWCYAVGASSASSSMAVYLLTMVGVFSGWKQSSTILAWYSAADRPPPLPTAS
ncbi:hypothetical protein B0E33_10420 [Roseibium algicola]|uniref:Uncharacterized protein n=1 Tax=Roseibium algicola TaxID=2857014 RepID=A0ABM6I0T4_9HYPH|nr:hypothetical protein B0E33_10420 [Roseibium aggregatum]